MAQRGDLKWGTVENLEMLIDEYFTTCNLKDDKGLPYKVPNIAGLCLHLGIHKDTFYYYADGRYEERLAIKAREEKKELIEAIGEEEIESMSKENNILCQTMLPYQGQNEIDTIKARVSDLLKTCKTRIENWNWETGYRMSNPAMAIFALKAVHRYSDQPQEINATQNNLNLNIKIEQPASNAPIITYSGD
jgi:hypothetical protein